MNEVELANLTLRELLWHSTVRIEYDNIHHGAGFFVTPQHVVTCAHVVKQINQVVRLGLYGGQSFDATVIDFRTNGNEPHNYPDLALLKVADDKYNSNYVLLDPDAEINDSLISYGFTADYSEGDSLTTLYEGWFQVAGYKNSDFIKLSNGQVQPGFSGSPLLNMRTGAVCGLIKTTRDKRLDIGGRGVSASLICHYFEEQLKTAQSPAQIKKTPWGILRLLSKAANNDNVNERVTLANFITHWTNWSSKKLEVYDADGLFSRNIEVDSPLETDWQVFIQAPPWRTELFEMLKSYEAAICNPGFEEMPKKLPDIDIKGSYEKVQKALEVWVKNVKLKLNSLESFAKNADKPDWQILKDISSLKKTLFFIEATSNKSKAQLQIGFLIFGAQGSGKTQFFRTRQSNVNYFDRGFDNNKFIPLLLPLELWSTEVSLDTLILTHINEASGGYCWKSLDEIDTFFSALNLKLVVMIDDFGRLLCSRIQDVRNFMITYTRLDSLFYLFTVQDTNLDVVVENTDSKLWKLLSYNFYHASCMSGWVNLGDFNRQQRIGFNILKAANEDAAATLLDERGHLDSPLVAQIVLELIQTENIHTIASLNFIGFLEAFWATLKKREKWDDDEIKGLISCVICAVFDSSSIKPPLDNIQKCLKVKNLSPLEDCPPLKNLKDTDLLRIVNSSNRGILCLDKPDKQVHLNYTFFWNGFLAEAIWDKFNPDSNVRQQKAISWLLETINDRTVREGIWEFVLLSVDAKAKETLKPLRVREIWLLAFDNPNLICAPCFAARWASKYTQKAVASTLISNRPPNGLVDREALFAFIFFAIETPALDPQTRFKLLRPYYQDIHELNLTDYFKYGAVRILKGLEKESELYSCLSELTNSHFTGCTEFVRELASVAWDVFVDLHGKWVRDNLKTLMFSYLLNDKKNAIEEYRNWGGAGRSPLFFREAFIAQALFWAQQQDGYKSSFRKLFDLLKEIDWYCSMTHGFDKHIAHEMQNEANCSFGKSFRSLLQHGGNIKNVEEYKILVNNLLSRKEKVKGIKHPEELGYFMLRHSGLEQRRGVMSIPSYLWGEFDIATRVSTLAPFFRSHPITK